MGLVGLESGQAQGEQQYTASYSVSLLGTETYVSMKIVVDTGLMGTGRQLCRLM